MICLFCTSVYYAGGLQSGGRRITHSHAPLVAIVQIESLRFPLVQCIWNKGEVFNHHLVVKQKVDLALGSQD
jgi:hypothetical protein